MNNPTNDNSIFNSFSVQDELENLLKDLHKEKIVDPIVQDLQDFALSLEKDPDRWLFVDLQEIFNPSQISEKLRYLYRQHRIIKIVNIFDTVRNVLILGPIFFTWIALGQASRAYRDFGEIFPERLNDSFLFLWENGFSIGPGEYILPNHFRFSSVAFIDVVIIGFVIILTLLVHWGLNQWLDGKDLIAQKLGSDLERILRGVEFSLSKHRQIQQVDILTNTRDLVVEFHEHINQFKLQGFDLLNSLQAEQQRVASQADQHQQELKQLRSFSADFKSGVGQLAKVIPEFSRTLSEFQKGVQAIANEVSEINRSQARFVDSTIFLEGFLGSFETIMSDLNMRVSQSAQVFESAAGEHSKRLDELIKMAATLDKTNLVIAQSQKDLQDALTEQRTVNSAWVSEIQTATDLINSAVQHNLTFSDSLDRFGKDLENSAQSYNAATLEITNLKNLILNLNQTLQKSQEIDQDQTTVVREATNRVGQFSLSAIELQNGVSNLSERLEGLSKLIIKMETYSSQLATLQAGLQEVSVNNQTLSNRYLEFSSELAKLYEVIQKDKQANAEWTQAVRITSSQMEDYSQEIRQAASSQIDALGELRTIASNNATSTQQLVQGIIALKEAWEKGGGKDGSTSGDEQRKGIFERFRK